MYILPILRPYHYLSTKMMNTNTTSDVAQTQTMNYNASMIGWISIKFPSGLALYWVISNLFQMGQQYIALRDVSGNKEVSR